MNKLEIKNLSKSYGGFCLYKVSFEVKAGSAVGLIGENGAGKSTVIKSVLGVIRPDGGEIYLDGHYLNDNPAFRKKLGYVLEDTGLPAELTLKEVSRVFGGMFSGWNEKRFLSLAARLELPADKRIKEFSKGMKMKAAISSALSYDTEALILDEPTSGLDPVARDGILDLLYDYREEGRAVLISSHITSDLEKLCDYIVYIHGGKVVLGGEKDELLRRFVIYPYRAGSPAPGGVRILKREFGADVLGERRSMPVGSEFRQATLEDIMLFYSKGDEI